MCQYLAMGCSTRALRRRTGWSRTYVLNASEDHLPVSCMISSGIPACAMAEAPPDLIECPDLLNPKKAWNLPRNHARVGTLPFESKNKGDLFPNHLSLVPRYALRASIGQLNCEPPPRGMWITQGIESKRTVYI